MDFIFYSTWLTATTVKMLGDLIEIRSNLSIFTDQFSEIIHVCTNFNLMIDLLFKQEFSQIFWSADKQVAPWSNKSSLTSVRRNPIKCLWFSSLSLFFVLILLLPLRLFLPPGVHVFQYRLSLPILEIVLWTPLGGTNRQVKRLLLRGYGEIPIKINPIGWQDAKRQYC